MELETIDEWWLSLPSGWRHYLVLITMSQQLIKISTKGFV